VTIRAPRLSLTDAIGAAAALTIAGGGYLLLIHKPLQEAGRLSLVRQAAEQTARDLAAMEADTSRLRRQIDAGTKKLASIGGGLPEAREIDRYLARVMAIAATNDIAIDVLSPLPASDQDDHQELHVNFVGRGSFAGFHRMLRDTERELEYGDVTHFSVVSRDAGSGSSCRLNWSLRIRTTRDTPITKAVAHEESP
jgi:hypothetical protein